MILYEPDSVYHTRQEISNSRLAEFDKSAYHFWAMHVDPDRVKQEPTDAMIQGSLTHAMVFEPDDVAKRYAVAPECDRRTKEGKAIYAEFVLQSNGQQIVSRKIWDNSKCMFEAVMKNPDVRPYLEMEGENEMTVLWTDPITGIACRGKPDRILYEREMVLDLKTTVNGSARAFANAIINRRYHVQSPFYLDGLAYSGDPRTLGASSWPFTWLVVESKYPHATALYSASDDWIAFGREQYRKDLQKYQHCMETNHWPSYTQGIQILEMPKYVIPESEPNEVY